LHCLLSGGRAVSAIAFLKAAVAYYESPGVTVTPIIADNGRCFVAKKLAKLARRSVLSTLEPNLTLEMSGKAERSLDA
jgi:pyridoxal/pyridoxine/pyridoxamine kinase